MWKEGNCTTCQKLKTIVGRGLCRACYDKVYTAELPERPCEKCGKMARKIRLGMCPNCYIAYNTQSLPERPCNQCGAMDNKIVYGLCRKCNKKRYNREHMPQILEYNKAWQEGHKERHKANQRRWDHTPHGSITNLLNCHRRLARLKNADGSGLTPKQWKAILDEHKHRCYYCHKKGKLTIDHKTPLIRGGLHDPANIVPACDHCNKSKGKQTAAEFLQKIGGKPTLFDFPPCSLTS